ncbi:MAG: hypothetical protein U5K69_21435 [Balneolaceae bacterium]|nr:hypothetical protein [Balneolaceae bacterium]
MSSIRDAKEAVSEINPQNIDNLGDVEDVQIVVDYITSELMDLEPFTNEYNFYGAISLTQILEFYHEHNFPAHLNREAIELSQKLYGLIDSAEYNHESYFQDGIFQKLLDVLEDLYDELNTFLNDLERATNAN